MIIDEPNNCNERNIQQQFVDEQIALKELLIFIDSITIDDTEFEISEIISSF